MWNWPAAIALLLALSAPSIAADGSSPFGDGETLRYTISYPSGLDLGEAVFEARQQESAEDKPGGWEFTFQLNAAIPGFEVADRITSVAGEGLCSLQLDKEVSHGKRTTAERTIFDQDDGTAWRETLGGGGKSEFAIPDCARDALTFLYHLRSELAAGRVPPPQKIFFGAPYEVSFQPAASQKVELEDERVDADQLIVTVKGAVSESVFILLVARDANRTPVRTTVPLEPGNFTLELAGE